MTDQIPCSHCGNGRIELTGILADTLELLRRQREEVSAVHLANMDGCRAATMNNRLTTLEGFGFVVSRRYGRFRLFMAKKNLSQT
jgi:DNA-binding IclR family transcriptional regulator